MDYRALVPAAISLKEPGKIVVRWSDGHIGVTSWERLRWNCPCAECGGEMGQPGRLSVVQTLTQKETYLQDLALIARYAVQPIWQDGHRTGLYTYARLRRLCECPDCDRSMPDRFEGMRLRE